MRSLVSTLPRHLPDAETGKRVGEAAKVGGGRALAALKRSVRVIAAARYFSDTGKGSRGLQKENKARAISNPASSDRIDAQFDASTFPTSQIEHGGVKNHIGCRVERPGYKIAASSMIGSTTAAVPSIPVLHQNP